jgi:hypothetical protein
MESLALGEPNTAAPVHTGALTFNTTETASPREAIHRPVRRETFGLAEDKGVELRAESGLAV